MAESHAPKHDYHLVDPSPWPLLSGIAAFTLAASSIYWFHGGTIWGPILGATFMLYCMANWWRDVIREAEYEGRHTPVVQLHHRYGMMLFIASEVMFFVAWFWAFFNSALFPENAGLTSWPPAGIEVFDPWRIPFINTLILLLSGTAVTWAHHAILENDRKGLIRGLACTVALG